VDHGAAVGTPELEGAPNSLLAVHGKRLAQAEADIA